MADPRVKFTPFKKEDEIRKFLQGKDGYFEAVTEGYAQTGLGILGQDPDSGIRSALLPGGDQEISFVYAIDNNSDPADGRLYLEDKFSFDAQAKFSGFKRQYFHNGSGERNQWQGWLARYEKSASRPSQAQIQEMVSNLALRFTRRPLTAGIIQALKTQTDYLLQALETALAVNPNAQLRIGDAQSYFNLHQNSERESRLTISFPVDDDKNPDNGRAFLVDQIAFDTKTHQVKNISRSWEASREATALFPSQKELDTLNQGKGPSAAMTQAFLEALLPAIASPATGEKVTSSASKNYEEDGDSSKRSRSDNIGTFKLKFNRILKSAYERELKLQTGLTIKGYAKLVINNQTGRVRRMAFVNLEIAHAWERKKIIGILNGVIDQLHAELKFQKIGDDPEFEIEFPFTLSPQG